MEHQVDCQGGRGTRTLPGLRKLIPQAAVKLARINEQTAVPAVAKDEKLASQIESSLRQVPTSHRLVVKDSRDLGFLPDESVHLVVTSPPYWTLKTYEVGDGQLGYIDDYDEFNDELSKVWSECLRLLVPGGRLVVNVGDVCLSRRKFGRHVVFPLHATIQERCRTIGFDNLAPIVWHKIANAKYEAGGAACLGKPYEPNGVIKNDLEWILFQRKPGGYRSPAIEHRLLSLIPASRHREWFQQIWTMGGTSTRSHPAPYPVGLAERLIRMFSFVGDQVLDPFSGTGTTSVAAAMWGRDSVGVEVQTHYHEMAVDRLRSLSNEAQRLRLVM